MCVHVCGVDKGGCGRVELTRGDSLVESWIEIDL
jgi:hypothetical protein